MDSHLDNFMVHNMKIYDTQYSRCKQNKTEVHSIQSFLCKYIAVIHIGMLESGFSHQQYIVICIIFFNLSLFLNPPNYSESTLRLNKALESSIFFLFPRYRHITHATFCSLVPSLKHTSVTGTSKYIKELSQHGYLQIQEIISASLHYHCKIFCLISLFSFLIYHFLQG